MNIQRIDELIERIDKEREHFEYDTIFRVEKGGKRYFPYLTDIPREHSCGTLGCIAGFAFMMYGAQDNTTSLSVQIAMILDISIQTAGELCCFKISGRTADHAIARLRHVREHGDLRKYDFGKELETSIV